MLGPAYREVSSGEYQSEDGVRQLRCGPHKVNGPTHHIHFEAYDGHGGQVIEETIVSILP